MTCCAYIQNIGKCYFNFVNGVHCIEDKKCNFFYDNLLFKKFKAPGHQFMYKKLFSVAQESWKDIYRNKVKDIYDKRICEFNYKLLNNTLCCNSFLFKCKYRASALCNMCDEIEDIRHLIFDCEHVHILWKNLSSVLNFDVQWKHVVLGFYSERNSKIQFLNTFVSFIAYKIYKFKMFCRVTNKTETKDMLLSYVKTNIKNNMNIFLNLTKTHMYKNKMVTFVEMF